MKEFMKFRLVSQRSGAHITKTTLVEIWDFTVRANTRPNGKILCESVYHNWCHGKKPSLLKAEEIDRMIEVIKGILHCN